jgi:hypothetical protein
MKSDTTTDRIIAVDYSQSLEAMIAAGKYDWVNDDITPQRFPVVGSGTRKFRTKLFHFDRFISSEDAVAAMAKEQFMPANHVHGTAYGATFPKDQLKNPIVCLGSSAWMGRFRRVVYLGRGGAGRGLDLGSWGGGWPDLWRFLGVQEVSEP